jgi:hypothetical protein
VDPSGLLRGDLEVRGPTSAVTEHMVEGILGAAPTLNGNGSVYLIAGTSEVLAREGLGPRSVPRLRRYYRSLQACVWLG